MPLKGKLFENPEEAVLFPSKRKDSRTVPYLGRREKKKQCGPCRLCSAAHHAARVLVLVYLKSTSPGSIP